MPGTFDETGAVKSDESGSAGKLRKGIVGGMTQECRKQDAGGLCKYAYF
ncbi:MAG TPA: hypothetical protein VF939_02365 [Puia sp.]